MTVIFLSHNISHSDMIYRTLLLFAIFIQFPCPYRKGKGEFQRYLSQFAVCSGLWAAVV